MINIPWGNDFALKVPIKKKVIQTTGEIEIQDFDVSSVEQLHVFLQHNEHLPDWHSSQVEWSADPENNSGIIVEVSSQMAPIGMYNIILTGVQNGRRFFSQQCRQFKIIGNASSSDLIIYEGIQTYTLDEVIVLDARGRDGLSAYELAVARGFEGTESEWMATLKGENGNGVAGVEMIEQVGNVDHYRMTFTDGTYFDYTVTNSSGNLTPEQIAEIVTELSNTITAGDLNAYTKTEVNNLLSSKANTSDIPTSLSDLNDDATHRTVTDTEKQVWNNKQELISDLNTIRQNASNAHQSLTGKQDVLVSGTNIKTINNESLLGSGNITVSSGGGGDVNVIESITFNGTSATIDSTTKTAAISYTPPVTSVNNQTGAVSLALGDTNVIETVKVNGTALTPTNKAVDISVPSAVTESTVSGWGFTKNTGTYSKPSGGIPSTDLDSSVQTSLGKADTALQSYTETDPVFSASPAAGITSSDITEWNGKADPTPVVNHGTSDTTFALTPNVLHVWGTVTALTLTLATPTDSAIVNEYMFQFTSGSTATTLSLPSSVEWAESCGALSVEASKTYQISIVNNIGLWTAISNS